MKRHYMNQVFQGPDLIPGLACMLLMIQAYLIAPLTPSLEKDFNSSLIHMAVPAFAIPFAIAAAAMVFLKPAVDLRKCILYALTALCMFAYILSTATSAAFFLTIRALTGFGTGIMLPSALTLALRPYKRKRSLDYMVLIIFALATGMTFGPSLGGWLNGFIGWRYLYLSTGALAALLFFIYFHKEGQERWEAIRPVQSKTPTKSTSNWKRGYSYSFAYLTGVFHSGVFVWISHYFTTRYELDEFHIATDLFIFGLPGFLASLLIYHYQLDKKVITILYLSLGLTASGLLVLTGNLPLWLAECALGVMSIGFGCSQPLFIGILKLPAAHSSPMEAIAKGTGILFAGYGSGPLMMIGLLDINLDVAMFFLIFLILLLAYISRRVWIKTTLK